jgi:hypothetical protein
MNRPKNIGVKTESKKTWVPPGKVEATKTDESKKAPVFTADDKALLEKQEGVIASNIGAFLVLGEALSIIKGRDLQKITDPNLTFDEYCTKKWGFGKTYAYRLIGGYDCVDNLKDHLAPNGVTLFPANEAQVRPLTSLLPGEQVKAWSAVLKKANGGGVTAAMVEEVLEETAGKPAKSYRKSKTGDANAKAELKKLKTITRLVEKALEIDPAERTIKKLSDVLIKIQELLAGEES